MEQTEQTPDGEENKAWVLLFEGTGCVGDPCPWIRGSVVKPEPHHAVAEPCSSDVDLDLTSPHSTMLTPAEKPLCGNHRDVCAMCPPHQTTSQYQPIPGDEARGGTVGRVDPRAREPEGLGRSRERADLEEGKVLENYHVGKTSLEPGGPHPAPPLARVPTSP